MKVATIFFISLLLTLNGLTRELLLINYQLNKVEITNKFCVNKDKPKLNCNGKCHLKKQLQKVDEQEKKSQQSQNKLKEIQLFIENVVQDYKLFCQSYKKRKIATFPEGVVCSFIGTIFNPPQKSVLY